MRFIIKITMFFGQTETIAGANVTKVRRMRKVRAALTEAPRVIWVRIGMTGPQLETVNDLMSLLETFLPQYDQSPEIRFLKCFLFHFVI